MTQGRTCLAGEFITTPHLKEKLASLVKDDTPTKGSEEGLEWERNRLGQEQCGYFKAPSLHN